MNFSKKTIYGTKEIVDKITTKISTAISTAITDIMSWCNERFSLRGHSHTATEIGSLGFPDYSKKTSISSGYTASTNGWVVFVQRWWTHGGYVTVNGCKVAGTSCYSHADSSGYETVFMFPVASGDTIEVTNRSTSHGQKYTLTFYPCR